LNAPPGHPFGPALLALKSYQRMGCFPKLGEVPDTVIDFALEKVVEAGVELPGFTTLGTLVAKVRTEVNCPVLKVRACRQSGT
jgi:hypothetical protein